MRLGFRATFSSSIGDKLLGAGRSDDRLLVDVERGLFVVAGARGPTYGGYYEPLGIDPGLAALVEAFDEAKGSPTSRLQEAVGAAGRVMNELHRAWEEAAEEERRREPDRLRASLAACRRIARERFGRETTDFAHFFASLTAVHLGDSSDGSAIAQIGACRAYRVGPTSADLLALDQTLGREMPELGDHHRAAETRLLGSGDSAEVRAFDVGAEERIVLCTAGTWEAFSDDELARVVLSAVDAKAIVDAARRKNPGSHADATVVVVDVVDP